MKTETKHTPGSWRKTKVEGDDEAGVNEYYRISGKNDDGVWATIAEVEHYTFEWEQFEANARLIAAAPDMLEVLELVNKIIGIGTHVAGCVKVAFNADEIDVIHAAIAKATGGQT